MAHQGSGTAGVEAIQRGLAEWTSSGAQWMRPYFLGLLGEAWALSGDIQRGLDALDEALAAAQRTGECWPEAELHQLRGRFLATLPDGGRPDGASAAFQRAIQIAKRQAAKVWELRAATMLARMWRSRGRAADARGLLTPIYRSFDEGLGTADLTAAGIAQRAESGGSKRHQSDMNNTKRRKL